MKNIANLFKKSASVFGFLVALFVFLGSPLTVFAQTCTFDKASCSWDPVSGASSYNVKVTEVDSGNVVKTDSITSGTTKIVFPVTPGKTYKCEVTAVNSCGSTGGTGSDSLLCSVPGNTTSPSPTPKATPTPPPATPAPVSTPTPSPVACGAGCNATTPCQPGLSCSQLAGGQSFCMNPAYQDACQKNPTVATCCQPPKIVQNTPKPTLPPAGDMDSTTAIAAAGVGLVVVAGFLLLKAGL